MLSVVKFHDEKALFGFYRLLILCCLVAYSRENLRKNSVWVLGVGIIIIALRPYRPVTGTRYQEFVMYSTVAFSVTSTGI
jgi:hypothetical protein